MMRFRRIFFTATLFAFSGPAALFGAGPDLNVLLTKADYLLNPKGSYEYKAELKVERPDLPAESRQILVLVQDPLHRRIIVETPKVEKGQSLLLEGDSFWMYLLKIKKSVRVPPQTAFAGEISSIDLGQPYFSMGYQAIGEETADIDGKPATALKLVPRTKTSVYAKVKLWMSQSDGAPIRAEFFNSKGKLAKTCFYEDYVEDLGAKRPTRWIYRDAATPGNQSVLTMGKMTRRNFDPAIFEAKASAELFNSTQPQPKSASGRTRPQPRAER